MSKQTIIRPITDNDIKAVTDIYAYYVENKEVTFEWDAPTLADMQARVQTVQNLGYPYLVIEEDGEIYGYAYVAPFRARVGWKWTVEVSIYLATDKGHKGYGYLLLTELIKACETTTDIRMLVSTISSKGNIASIRLHQKAGFRIVGTMLDVGYKFGEWHDVVIMQKSIGKGANSAPKI